MANTRRRGALALFASAALLALSAGTISANDEAQVRVLHAGPDAPPVDVWLDGSRVEALTNVPFGTLSDYLSIPAGPHDVQVFATGTDADPVIDAAGLEVSAGVSYTIAATGFLSDGSIATPQVLVDDPEPKVDMAQLRVVHFAADAPAVDIAPDGGDALVEGLEFPNATAYLDIPGGEYDLEVRANADGSTVLDLDPLTVNEGTSYSAFAIGSLADGAAPLTVIVGVDATAQPDTSTVTDAAATALAITPAIVLAMVALGMALLVGRRFSARRVTTRD